MYEGELAPAPPADTRARGPAASPRTVPDGWGAYTQGPSPMHAELDARARLTPLVGARLGAVLEGGSYASVSSSSALQLAHTWRAVQARADGRADGVHGDGANAPSPPQPPQPPGRAPTDPTADADAARLPRAPDAARARSDGNGGGAGGSPPRAPPAVPTGGSQLVGEWRAGRPFSADGGGEGGSSWWQCTPCASLEWWYRGGWLGGLRHGEGTCVYYERALLERAARADVPGSAPSVEPLAVFSGEWRHGRWDGNGTLRTSQPARTLVGQFRGGLRAAAVRVQLSPDGALYTGEMANGVRAGVGMSVEPPPPHASSTDVPVEYLGEWFDDLPHGLGKRTDSAGEFEGAFERGVPHGAGVLRKRTGAVFRGTWVLGVMEGRGRALPADGARADGARAGGARRWTEGVWVHGALDFASVDRGTARVDGDGAYEGSLRSGEPHGAGRAHWANGDTIDGVWAHGELDTEQPGMCVRTAPNGDRFVGECRGGTAAFPRPHGFGALMTASGDRCEGSWVDGMPQDCDGVLTLDGQRYEGAWRGGVRTGRGKLSWPSGDEYEGHFVEGLPHGRGEQRYEDGSIYRGLWRRGVPHGRGQLIEPSGRATDAQWADGKQVGAPVEPTPRPSVRIHADGFSAWPKAAHVDTS